VHYRCTNSYGDVHVRQSGLFGTAAAMRLIGLFYINPKTSFRLIEIVTALRDSVNRRAAINTLNQLVADGFVEKVGKGESSRYRANPRCYVFDELASIAVKTLGGYEEIIEEIGQDPNIVTAAIYGSFAKGSQRADSDIDLALVARDPGALSLFDLLGRLETIAGHAGRQVNATTYTESEAASGGSEFLSKVLNGPVIWLKGGDRATRNDPC
jgi:predicted nucleotidyltransferase